MPELNGVEVIRQIHRIVPGTKILVVTMHDTEDLIRECLEAGARGYLVKTEAARHLVHAIEAIRQRKPFFASEVAEIILQGYLQDHPKDARSKIRQPRLTLREREIVQLPAEGKSNKELSIELGISVRTAESHRSNIMRKLDLHSLGSYSQ